ncbi:hypothetical protein JIR001_14450 [Polycladomyces abyssicola]|uniref:Uncharacterized protein n=1 Tax=Polycladomyces abyssicola TaxID=1125966 RepID=A0A8D5ZN74_9BACL|nr:hypothetical protein JIR001_14450 [Polycladomyces abyssicola]
MRDLTRINSREEEVSVKQAIRIISLRRGETRTVRCGRRSLRTRRFTIRPGEVLVVICARTRRVFVFFCRGFRIRRTIVGVVPENTVVTVRCL